jgi:probable rRNA maturation factor
MFVDVVWEDRRCVLDRTLLDALCAAVESGEGKLLPVSLLVTDDARIRRVNREALGHDWETDVVTFDLAGGGDDSLVGEIVVSSEFAESTARELSGSVDAELLFYVCHGLLHLCGYDDADPDDRARMLDRQRDYLRKLGIAPPK